MSFQAYTWVLENSTSKGTARLVLCSIAHHADEQGRNSWPGVELLMHEANASETAVHRALKHLEVAGHIVVEHQKGGPPEMRDDRRPNRYTVIGVPPTAPRPKSAPGRQPGQGPGERSRHGVPTTAPGSDRGVPPARQRGAAGEGHGVPPAVPRGAASGTRTIPEHPEEGTDQELTPDLPRSSTSPARPDGRTEEEHDDRLTEVWAAICDRRLALRRSDDPILDVQAWRRKVIRKDRRELMGRARELLGWYPTLTTGDLAQALLEGPDSYVLDRHPRAVCATCSDSGMVDTGAGYTHCPVCRPGRAVSLHLDEADR